MRALALLLVLTASAPAAAAEAADASPTPAPEASAAPSATPAASPAQSATPPASPAPAATAEPAASPAPTVALPKSPELEPVPTPVLAPTPAPTPVAHPWLDAHLTRWPVEVTLSWDQALATRRIHAALDKHSASSQETILVAADASPWRGLAIGADLAVDSTRTLLVAANGQGCGPYTFASTGTNCQNFTQDVWYETQTNYASVWAKPYLTFGAFRTWAAVGAGLAVVDYLYTRDPAFDDQSWGKGTSRAFGVNAAVGGDWAYKLAPNGACFIVSASLAAGGPNYSEHVDNLFYPNHVWSTSNAGTAVNPLRFAIGIGFSFPTKHAPGD
ncbi:MAG TPA: hypothetical protein VMV18_05040 [bacterium]|nr:hypothetical protein [bacterium]